MLSLELSERAIALNDSEQDYEPNTKYVRGHGDPPKEKAVAEDDQKRRDVEKAEKCAPFHDF